MSAFPRVGSFCMNGQFQIGALSPKKYFFYVAFFVGLLFALNGQDDADLSILSLQGFIHLSVRFINWQFQALGLVFCMIFIHLALARVPAFEKMNPWGRLGVSGALATAFFTPFAFAMDVLLGMEEDFESWIPAIGNEFLALVLPATVAWLAMNAPWLMGFSLQKQDETGGAEELVAAESEGLPAFMKLVPKDKRGALYYLKSELHYLSVVTDKGSSLVLYNLRDAIEEYGEQAGLLIHRSYWVPRDAVKNLKKEGRQGRIELTSGEHLPVSRRNYEEVAQALAV